MPKFKVGDRVICKGPVGDSDYKNMRGTIILLCNYQSLVEFDKYIEGHNGNTRNIWGKDGHCWYCINDSLILEAERKIKEFGIVKFMKETTTK